MTTSLKDAIEVDVGAGFDRDGKELTCACEFGSEVIIVIPYVNYLFEQGVDVTVRGCKGMSCFYHFLPEGKYREEYVRRGWTTPKVPLRGIHWKKLDKSQWKMPDYKSYYKKYELPFEREDKPIVMIHNKYNEEWGRPPVNFLSLDTLDTLFTILKDKYTIVYNRPRPKNIVNDHNIHWSRKSDDLGDYKLIEDIHTHVIDLQRVCDFPEDPGDYNKYQMIVGAHTDKHISVQGGNSILASLFGGVNVVYAVRGHELENNSFRGWYHEFSGCETLDYKKYDDMISCVVERFL